MTVQHLGNTSLKFSVSFPTPVLAQFRPLPDVGVDVGAGAALPSSLEMLLDPSSWPLP